MVTGEMDFTDIPIERDSSLSGLEYLFFLLFVFNTVIILMNLLNGLAVSDVSSIEKDAEYLTFLARLEIISSFDKHFLKFQKILSLCSKTYQLSGVFLFNGVLQNGQYSIKPNKKRHWILSWIQNTMDVDIISKSKKILSMRNIRGIDLPYYSLTNLKHIPIYA